MRSHDERGVVMVETALVLPILLMLLVGIFLVGHAMVRWQLLQHAAIQGVNAGIGQPVPQRCPVAEDTAASVFGLPLASNQCSQPGNDLRLSLEYVVPMVPPLDVMQWTIGASAEAVSP
jgi:hypothetical protein